MNNYRRRKRITEYEQPNNALPIVLAIFVAAIIIIGGYIGYCEYKENQAKIQVEKILDKLGGN